MSHLKLIALLPTLIVTMLSSCSDKSNENTANQPTDDVKCTTQLYDVEYVTNDEFDVDTIYNADGYYCVSVEHNMNVVG